MSRASHEIDLRTGWPHPSLLPIEKLKQASIDLLDNDPVLFAQYSDSRGHIKVRQCIYDYTKRLDPRSPISLDSIVLTAGSGQALDCVCGSLLHEGDTVIIDDPVYFLAYLTLQRHHLTAVPCSVDEQGLSPTHLQELIDLHHPKAVYTSSAFSHNPTGSTMSEKRAQELVKICRDNGVILISDEVYLHLRFNETTAVPRTTLRSFDDPDKPTVISLGSLAKVFAPGIRVGWAECHPSIAKRLPDGGMESTGGYATPGGALSTRILPTLHEYLPGINQAYRERCKVMCDALTAAGCFEYIQPTGGFFVWARVDGVDAEELREHCKGRVRFLPGWRCSANGKGSFKDYIRLCFAYLEEEEMVKGVKILTECIKELKQ